MTEGPPPSAASTSKTTTGGENGHQIQLSPSTPTNPNGKTKQHYAGKTIWPTAWPSQQNQVSPGAAQTAISPQQMGYNPYSAHLYYTERLPKPVQQKPSSNTRNTDEQKAARLLPPIDPTASQDWDDVVKTFLHKTKMTETLRGFESDMLVLNSEWEKKVIPGALKEMISGLQAILDQMAGKAKQDENAMDVEVEVDVMDSNGVDEVNSLNERKMKYVHLSNGAIPRPQSSINKSISDFLSRTRARNDASNRAEFLVTLAEKKRKFAEELEGSVGHNENVYQNEITSCARVDAKKIDRDKQMKYDIAKYGEGPLIATVKSVAISPPLPAPSEGTDVSTAMPPSPEIVEENEQEVHPVTKKRPKRKLVDSDDEEEKDCLSGKPSRRSKRKGRRKERKQNEVKEEPGESEEDPEEHALSLATAEKHPGIDDRLKNIETHLAVRFVPTPPRTLLSRLVFLEDHIIKLEKEYPPWAALHFNQPNRGWPPPPRTTPIIIPPHLRTFATTATTAPLGPSSSSSTTPSVTPVTAPAADLNASTSLLTKPKKIRSSLHKAVLERMEVQRAMSEMGSKTG